MSTQASNALNRDNPADKIVIRVNAADWWDDTNKRWKSGYVTLSMTGLTWTPTTPGGTEKLRVVTRAYNDNPDNHDRTEATYAISAGTAGTLSLALSTAVNYGTFGPSALVEDDGTVSLFCVELSLEQFALAGSTDVTGLVATATYTLNSIVIDPYAALVGGSTNYVTLGVHKQRNADWAIVEAAGSGLSGYSALAVQFAAVSSTTTAYGEAGPPPNFRVATAPQSGPGFPLYDAPVSRAPSAAPSPAYPATWVFAITGGKLDGNSSRMTALAGFSLPMLNLSLVKPVPGGAKVDVTATIRSKIY